MYSAVSRAILKRIYQFGIPNSNPHMLKSIDFWCKLSSTFLVTESQESNVLSYSEPKIAKNFQGFTPGPHWGELTAPLQTPHLHPAPPKYCWIWHWYMYTKFYSNINSWRNNMTFLKKKYLLPVKIKGISGQYRGRKYNFERALPQPHWGGGGGGRGAYTVRAKKATPSWIFHLICWAWQAQRYLIPVLVPVSIPST